ncbi:AP-3 complex subunit delta [Emydomyces testavorans]|uniref:AP-3 complex subunit delta n=1 Tax=Emydomyces testavorans TaxID=2070801 RepID=A0AAF0DKV0_9EURO|nr:AP-3 complex subunit delta [Emydomyces testavorans]
MFGYDMSWAAFHVLEVMSSQKYLQKRVGYLGAVQSFRSDTEVLMLATNLLKKDIVSPLVPTMSLPLLTLPHIISPSLALSLLSDLLPRLSHSHPSVRKKTVVNLYRLSLVYPEAFRQAWPKIKERLMDEHEDSSVTAAVTNVICELGWRRPRDFLPLAPRLFNLLVDGGNNWMAIKIIKLFASLTPLEPRLVRKLLRPLTTIIQTTSAMSLLYECINGVIQGGILEGSEGVREGEFIAQLCVEKLRGMLVLEGDPNRKVKHAFFESYAFIDIIPVKYVALLAFNRIVLSHPTLVSQQQDVIMLCLDNNDVSIRLQALELVSRMVTSESLQPVVNRLITQLQSSPHPETAVMKLPAEVKLSADIEGEDPEEPLETASRKQEIIFALPNEYRIEVLNRIIDMCSRNTYSAVPDFEWYVDVLLKLVKLIPPSSGHQMQAPVKPRDSAEQKKDFAARIGSELRNVAVRVKSARPEATRAAESLILIGYRAELFPTTPISGISVLESTSWVVGEYCEYLTVPDQVLYSLIDESNLALPPKILSSYLQAIPKIFVRLTTNCNDWSMATQSEVSRLLACIVDFLKKLSSHPDLEVQERAIAFLELFNLSAEAVSTAKLGADESPLLISSAIPSLFSGLDLNPVATGAQKKVPVPDILDLDNPLNEELYHLLNEPENGRSGFWNDEGISDFYHLQQPNVRGKPLSKEDLAQGATMLTSHQDLSGDIVDPVEIARRQGERRERTKDDPFYIGHNEGVSGSSTPLHKVLQNFNGDDLDIDSIPIISLGLDKESIQIGSVDAKRTQKPRDRPKKIEIIADETIDIDEDPFHDKTASVSRPVKAVKPLLEVDSSGLGHLSLEERSVASYNVNSSANKDADSEEIAKAMEKIERLRLEMQRASEQIHAGDDVPPEGTLVKRKKKVPNPKRRSGKNPSVQDDSSRNSNPLGEAIHTKDVRKKKKKKRITSRNNIEPSSVSPS